MTRLLFGLLVIAIAPLAGECQAQSSLFGSSSGNVTTGLGASSNQSSGRVGSGGMGTTGSRTGSSSSSGGSMFGSSSGSSSGSGTSSLTQSNLNAGDGSVAATIGQNSFVGRGENSSRFVGSRNSSTANTRGANQMSLLQGLIGNNDFTQNSNNNNAQTQSITPQLRLGFALPPLPAVELQSTVQSRLVGLPALGTRSNGVIAKADPQGLVVLTGSVQSEEDRLLMETLVRMEPGVRSVRNELAVRATP